MTSIVTLGAKPQVRERVSRVELEQALKTQARLWVDIDGFTKADAPILLDTFSFHHLSVEDCLDDIHYPKVEQFPNYVFVILHTVEVTKKHVPTSEVDFFLTPKVLVTVHQRSSRVLEEVRRHIAEGALATAQVPDRLFHIMSSRYIDEYFPLLDSLDREIDQIEDTIFKEQSDTTGGAADTINRFLSAKKRITLLRRLLSPQRDVFSRLSRSEFSLVSPQTVVYFRDVYDRLFRITEILDSFRDVLSSTLEAHLSVVSNRLNEVMKVLTIVTVILLPLTVVTGIYGMNFQHMPELRAAWGYPCALGLMVVIVASLVWYFKRRRWL
jgi:magnesium transporter